MAPRRAALALWLGAAASLPPRSPAQPGTEDHTPEFTVEGDPHTGLGCTATVETLGCFTDSKFVAHTGRDMPYNLVNTTTCQRVFLIGPVLQLSAWLFWRRPGVQDRAVAAALRADHQRALRQALPRLVAAHPGV